MTTNSQAKWNTLIGWFSVGILQYEPLPRKRSVSVFFSLPGNSTFKMAEINFSSQQYNCSKRNLVLHVKGFRLKLADGRRSVRPFTKRRSVRSLKETIPYNKQLTNLTCSGPYWGILALRRFCADFAAFGPYCHDLCPIIRNTALALG